MAKSNKKNKRKTAAVKVRQPGGQVLPQSFQDALFIILIAVILVILLKPLVVDHLSPQGVDVLATIGQSHQIREFTKESGERALWNPYIFAGMPVYHRLSAVAFSADNLLGFFSRFFSVVFIYYFFAALGFYILLRYMKMSPLLSFLGSLLFIFMPHYKSLFLVGHFAKFKALMLLPWVFLTFQYFMDKRNILSAALFALAFGTQIRTQHYQIVFYTGVLIFAAGVYPFIKELLDKQYQKFGKSLSLLVIALILSISMSAQPLFLAKEYLPYSKRGKTTVDIHQQEKARNQAGSGVSMKYATQWSTDPLELFTWFVPRFFGGMSSEKYDGNAYPRLRGQQIPAYWGYMPFTQSYEYMGAITLLLALLGLIIYRKKPLVISLGLFALWLILLSFGRHMEWFYALFYNYVPYFNKFRAPMMSVAVTYFVIVLFAMMGLKYLASISRGKDWFKENKTIIYTVLGFFILGLIFWLYGQGASFTKPGGERYQPDTLRIIKNIRAEYFNHDVLRYLLLILISGGSLFAYLAKKINFTILTVFLGLIAIMDLLNVQGRVQKDYTDVKRIERQYFRETQTDQYLKSDHTIFRIFPSGELFGNNRWAYFHQTIGGYTPIKMYTIEELVEKNIYNGPDAQLPINWNVLKILDVKYVIMKQIIQNEHLQLVFSDKANHLYTYLFKDHLPRAHFVGRVRVVPDEIDRLKYINSPAFNPGTEAVLEKPLPAKISTPDSSWTRLKHFYPNHVSFSVYTDKQSLLVLSENFYPPGWRIFIDGKETNKIYKTDHAIQSIVVAPGEHHILLNFEPKSFFRDIHISYASLGILYLMILIGLVPIYRKKYMKK